MPVNRFVVFDVETPNRYNNRMSAIGIDVIEDGRIVQDFFSYVDPEQPFDWFNTVLTGINEETVFDAPCFSELWPQIEGKPSVKGLCTVVMGRSLLPGISHKLNDMCDYYGISLHHHQADSDSRACAEILLRYLESGADAEKYIRTYRMD